MEFLGFLRGQVLAPLAMDLCGLSPRGVRRLEQHLLDLVPDLAGTVAGHDRDTCGAAVRRCVDLCRTLRDQLPVQPRRGADAEEAAVRYLDAVIGQRR
ncbi:MAG TPA: hypothetical protein VGE14_13415 [Marmoricola sp.]